MNIDLAMVTTQWLEEVVYDTISFSSFLVLKDFLFFILQIPHLILYVLLHLKAPNQI